MKKNTSIRLLLLVIGTVVSTAVICLEVLQYHQFHQVQQEHRNTENDQPADEALSMPACAQGTAVAQENSSAQYVIQELFSAKADDEPATNTRPAVWSFLLEKILRVVIAPNAP